MIVTVMQPYFFPYIGYFQLMAACDVFVVHDDVQFIKGGWINRNQILANGAAAWIVLPVAAGSHSLRINERNYVTEQRAFRKVARQVQSAYRGGSHFDATLALVEDALTFPDRNVAAFNANSLRNVARVLGIKCRILAASELIGLADLRGEEKVIAICRALKATRYVNPIGGAQLYHARHFAEHGIALSFLKSEVKPYAQFAEPHIPSLSIVDALMFNNQPALADLLTQWTLLDPPSDRDEMVQADVEVKK
jgi:hypothetical protein